MQSQLGGHVSGNQHSLQNRDQKSHSSSTKNSSFIQYYTSGIQKELHIILFFFLTHFKVQFLKPNNVCIYHKHAVQI